MDTFSNPRPGQLRARARRALRGQETPRPTVRHVTQQTLTAIDVTSVHDPITLAPSRPISVEPAAYRDRISVVTWLIVFGLGLSLLLDVPVRQIGFVALGSPISFQVGGSVLTALVLLMIAAAGTQSVLSVHPDFLRAPRRTWAFWALPMALSLIAVLLLPQAPTRLIQVAVIIGSGILVALSLFCLYSAVEAGQPGFRRARLTLNALAYGSALLFFLFVYQTRTRSLLSGTSVALTGALLAVEVLRSRRIPVSVVLSHGAAIGLVLGQVTWALNYWRGLPDLSASLLLLLIFYLMVGVTQQGLQQRLNRRVLLEFLAFAVLALVLIAAVGPGFG